MTTRPTLTIGDKADQLGISRNHYYRLQRSGKLANFSRRHSIDNGDHRDLLDQWVQWREQGLYCKPWSDTYRYTQLLMMGEYFKHYKQVSPEYLEEWLQGVPPIQHSKRKDMYAAVSSFAKFLAAKGAITAVDYARVKMLYPKMPPAYQPVQKIISTYQLTTLLEKAEENRHSYQRLLNKTLLTFLSETGLRATESCQLKVSDLRFSDTPKDALLFVRKGKGSKARVVPFSKAAQACIRMYLDDLYNRCGEQEYLFRAFNPKHGFTDLTKDCIGRRFRMLSEKAKVPFSAHSLRHYRITQWANNPRIPITVVQMWAGHSSLAVTQRYIHIRDEDAMEAAFD